MLSIDVDTKQMDALSQAVRRAGKSVRKELAAAINQVSRKTKRDMGKQIRTEVTLKKKESEKPLSIRGKASTERLQVTVSLKKTPRLGLRHFGARQDKRGVSYKISKKSGRSRVDGAFQGPKPRVMKLSWRGNVFKRQGKARLPIVQIKGVSPYGVYQKNNLAAPQAETVGKELTKQIERRINLNVLRANGLVKT